MEELSCPKCSRAMVTGNRSVLTCTGCQGVWLPAAQYGTALKDAGGPSALTQSLSSGSQPTGFTCPECRTGPLLASHHKSIEIDWCDKCMGVYFDKGELDQIHARKASLIPVGPTIGDAAAGAGGWIVEGLFLAVEAIIQGAIDGT